MVGPDLRRLVSAVGVYAMASVAQKGLAFLLIPIYTRHIDPAQYGILELLNAFSTIAFGILALGMPSALMKCFHRDCRDVPEQQTILATSAAISLPSLLLGSIAAVAFAEPLSRLLLGDETSAGLVRIAACSGFLSSFSFLVLADLRAEERSRAYSIVVLFQFLVAAVLNIVLVVYFEMGVRGVLTGNLVSYLFSLPLALMMVAGSSRLAVTRSLMKPLLAFGLLMVPGVLTGWINNLSDRYILRLLTTLDEVAVYGVGYKFGSVIRLVVVWPFQLAWPALAFSISDRDGHKITFARTLTYLSAVLMAAVLGLSILSRVAVPWVVGAEYEEAYRVVPLVALAYAFSGVFFCLNPGVHIAGKTRFFPVLSALSAGLNIGLNFLLIPVLGMMGAAWATVGSFAFSMVGGWLLAQRFYPVEYEYSRLVKIVLAGLVVWVLATRMPGQMTAWSWAWHCLWAICGFPLALVATRFLTRDEISALRSRVRALFGRVKRPGP